MAKSSKRPPWKQSNPRKKAGKASKHLSPAKKQAAKASAKRVGRPYPNLVDNMHAASTKKTAKRKTTKAKTSKTKSASKKSAPKTFGRKKKSSRKKTAARKKKSAGKKSARKKPAGNVTKTSASTRAVEKDPHGGLTAAGRRAFARKQGAHLKPGVRKAAYDMTPTEMRRKGSWAVRFYGRAKLPPLIDRHGEPTRLALSAHAWGEPVPRTIAAARRIAAKGEGLLARYRRVTAK